MRCVRAGRGVWTAHSRVAGPPRPRAGVKLAAASYAGVPSSAELSARCCQPLPCLQGTHPGLGQPYWKPRAGRPLLHCLGDGGTGMSSRRARPSKMLRRA